MQWLQRLRDINVTLRSRDVCWSGSKRLEMFAVISLLQRLVCGSASCSGCKRSVVNTVGETLSCSGPLLFSCSGCKGCKMLVLV